jgi:hypothetical protein
MRHNHNNKQCEACEEREVKLIKLRAEIKYYRRQFVHMHERIERLLAVENHTGGKKLF